VQKGFLIAASVAGLTAVALGAFGAHRLQSMLDAHQLTIWDKGVQYQIYHALALFMCYVYLRKETSTLVRNAGICFILGIVCFSGSLYLLATRDLTNIPIIILGPMTPIGGFFFIAGWGLILMQAVKKD
jgi:uncharacterized membrane protein YgdD (TMEM256/DUF423 family)